MLFLASAVAETVIGTTDEQEGALSLTSTTVIRRREEVEWDGWKMGYWFTSQWWLI